VRWADGGAAGERRADEGAGAVLSDAERGALEEALGHYADRRSAVITALKIVQRHRGWVSDEALRDVAEALGLSAAEIESRATFYNLIFRRPVGRHVILVCDSVACWIDGYGELRAALEERLGVTMGETSADGRFTLLPVVCLGACDRAPAMLVDDDLHGPVRPEDLPAILEGYP
jgi:NADH-quinone oxidoreductase subunit E